MGNMYLVKFSSDWADEFTMEGFVIMNEEKFRHFMNCIENAEYPRESYFGTNEFFEFSSKEDVLECIEVKQISNDDVIVIKRHFNCGFGHMPSCSDWLSEDEE
jgi:hypothetical protein